MWLITLLALFVLVFMGYAIYTQYSNTDPGAPIFKRVWAAILLAVATIGALIMAFFQGTPF